MANPFEDEAAAARDLQAQERAGVRPLSVGVVAPAVFHAVSPLHGEPVVFAPGELLPAWAADVLPDASERVVGTVLVLDATRPRVRADVEPPVARAPRRTAAKADSGRKDW